MAPPNPFLKDTVGPALTAPRRLTQEEREHLYSLIGGGLLPEREEPSSIQTLPESYMLMRGGKQILGQYDPPTRALWYQAGALDDEEDPLSHEIAHHLGRSAGQGGFEAAAREIETFVFYANAVKKFEAEGNLQRATQARMRLKQFAPKIQQYKTLFVRAQELKKAIENGYIDRFDTRSHRRFLATGEF